MSKKSPLRQPFDKQKDTRAKALLKSWSQHIYHIYWTVPSQLSWKTSPLLTCRFLGLFVNTLATDEKSPVLTRDKLTIPIQMQWSQKQKTFPQFSAAFLKFKLNFKYFEKKVSRMVFVFPKLRTPKAWSDKSLKTPVSPNPSTSNMVNIPKHCWNLYHSTFIPLIDHSQVNWVGKSLRYIHAKSLYWLLTYCLPMKSILFLRETI